MHRRPCLRNSTRRLRFSSDADNVRLTMFVLLLLLLTDWTHAFVGAAWPLLLNEYWLIDWIPDCGCWHYALPSRSGVSSPLCSLHCTHIWHNPSDIPRTHPELLSAFTEINGIITILKLTSCARGDTICPRPSPPRGRPSASRAAEQTQRSFPRPIRSHGHRCTCFTR